MNESGYGPRTRRRAVVAIAALLGCILAVLPMSPAHAATAGLTVTSPTFEDDFPIGSTLPITWATNQTTGTVDIDLYNGASVFQGVIKHGVTSKLGKYAWTIPMTQALGTYRIKVTHVSSTVSDLSKDAFNITLPVSTVLSPKTGDVWVHGTSRVIRWKTGGTGPVALDLLDNSDVFVASINGSKVVQAAAGTYNWDIPVGVATASGLYKVRVKSVAAPAVTASSVAFTLNLPTITVDQPSLNGITWGAGTVQQIKWTTSIPGNVKIDVFDVGAPGTSLFTKTVSSKPSLLNWTVPHAFATGASKYKVSVTAVGTAPGANLVTDTSDFAFGVALSAVSVTDPPTLVAGNKTVLHWTTTITGNVKVELTDTGGTPVIAPIAASIPGSTGQFSWSIPINVATASGTYKIKVTTLTATAVSGSSNAFALNLPTITVADPVGAPWDTATTHAITWTTNIPSGNVKIDLVNGATVTAIAASVPAKNQTYNWTVPALQTAQGGYTIKITALGNTQGISFSNTTPFTIQLASITAVSNNAVTAGGTGAITWTTPITGNVKVLLLDGAGNQVSIIKASVAASPSTFNWSVPITVATATATYKIRVVSLANGSVVGTGSTFTLTVPQIVINAPTGTPGWVKGTSNSITWTATGLPGNVKIELISPTNVTTVIKSSIAASTGTFSWAIPSGQAVANGYSIKITSLSNPGLSTTAALNIT